MRRGERIIFYGCSAAAALAVATAYSNHFHNAFHFDDAHTIENNLYIRDLKNLPFFFRSAAAFSSLPTNQSYRPLVTTTLAIDYRLAGGLDPFWYHITNFSLFAAQCLLLYFLYRRLLDEAEPRAANRWTALFAATWYGLHAAHAETVNYLISRTDILSTLGVVSALLLYVASPRARRFHLYLLPVALGMLAKESAAIFAPLLFLYIGLFERQLSVKEILRPRNFGAIFLKTLPSLAVCFGLFLLAMNRATSWTSGGGSRLDYLLTQPFVIVHYLVTFILPLNLSADTDWKAISNPLDDRVIVGVFVVLALLWAAVRTARQQRTRPIAFGLLWFFLALLPTSSVVPFSEVLNDHRVYFPYVGLILAVSSWLALAFDRLRLRAPRLTGASAAAAAVLLLAGHAYGTHRRNEVWSTDEALWLDVTRKSPENGRGWMNYGLARMRKADFPEAIRCFERALALAPRYGYAHVNLAIALAATGRAAEAESHFVEALAYQPDVPSLHYFYARWLDQAGRGDDAVRHLLTAIRLSPNDIDSRHLLLHVRAKRWEWPELAELARQTLEIQPADDDALRYARIARANLSGEQGTQTAEELLAQSLTHFQNGRYESVIATCQRALQLRPDYAEAFNNQCAAYNALGRFAEAKAACERALELKPDFELARNNLSIADRGLQSARR